MHIEEERSGLFDSWALLRPRIVWFVLVSALIAAALFAYSLQQPDKYTTSLRFAAPKNADAIGWVISGDEMLSVMDRRYGLRKRYDVNSLRQLRREWNRNVVVKKNKEGFVDISVTDTDPRFATEFANRLAEQARQQVLEHQLSDSARILAQDAMLLKQAQSRAKSADAKLQAPDTSATLRALPALQRLTAEGVAKIQAETAMGGLRAQSTELVSPNQELIRLQSQLMAMTRESSSKGAALDAGQLHAIAALQTYVYWQTLVDSLVTRVFMQEAQALADLPYEPAVLPDSKSNTGHLTLPILGFVLSMFVCVFSMLGLIGLQKAKKKYLARTSRGPA